MKRFALIIFVLLVAGAAVYELAGHASTPASAVSNGTSDPGARSTETSATTEARQYTVLFDVSASRPSGMIAEGERFVDTLIDHMRYGDRLLILQMYEAGVNEGKAELDLTLAKAPDSVILDQDKQLQTDRDGLKEPVHIFFGRAQRATVMHTDILTTLSIASEKISDDKKNELIILSDMLQSSQEFEFEHLKHMPPPNWIAEQKLEGLVRPLYGACVLVVGGDPSTHEGVVVRDFWEKYFEASNAVLNTRNYRTTAPTEISSKCD